MSILSNIRKAFGFHDPRDDEEFDDSPLGYNREESRAETGWSYGAEPPVSDDREDARLKMIEENDRLSNALKKVTAERDRACQQQLSAERQKRALSDRLCDLDQRVAELENEKERLAEENRMLKISARRQDGAAPASTPENGGDDSLSAENESLKKDIETLKTKVELGDSLVKELQSKAATATRECQQAKRELDEARRELDEAHQELEDAAKAIGNLKRFEQYKQKTDMRLAELNRSISIKDKEIRSLNSTIEHNLVKHAEAQQLLLKEIEQLRAGTPSKAATHDDADESLARESKRKTRNEDDSQLTLF